MMLANRLSTTQALKNAKTNAFASWNRSPSSSERSVNGEDASNRIFDSFATVRPEYHGPKLNRASPVFAMGSCFAREIENALMKRGCNVISVDKRIHRPEFQDDRGRVRSGFFHRFTPFAMLQEFQQAFGELEGWEQGSLLIEQGGEISDLNYWDVPGSDKSMEAIRTRRKLAAELVRTAADADVVILTLGLIESWVHKPTGFHANKVPPHVLVKQRDDFELHLISVDETLHCLSEIRSLIERYRTTPFQMVITVSPVPLQKTFTSNDLIIANMDSKSTLRAAAARFCKGADNIHYFPSYEMVSYTHTDLAWRPDRVHVDPGMVTHIVNTFTEAYYAEGEV